MEKPKKIAITSLAILGVIYGAATATASPFMTWYHNIEALISPEVVAQSTPIKEDVELDSGAFSALTLMADAGQAFVVDRGGYVSVYTDAPSGGVVGDLQQAVYISESGSNFTGPSANSGGLSNASSTAQETIVENVTEYLLPPSHGPGPTGPRFDPDGDPTKQDDKILIADQTPVAGPVSTSNHNVPEPATLAMLGLGFAGLLASRRRRV